MVKTLKKSKTAITISITLILALTLIQNTRAQPSSEMQTFFSKDYAGISIKVNATRETVPGENITINLWINCTATGVNVDCLTLSVYGFRYGQKKIQLNSTDVIKNKALAPNNTSQHNYTVPIPNDVWGTTDAELSLKYTIVNLHPEYNPIFWITIVRNVYLEELENKLNSLNSTFWESFQMNLSAENLARLNQTYFELQQNYTSLQGSLSELDNTRRAVIILAITTVSFVATTIYLLIRKPKQQW